MRYTASGKYRGSALCNSMQHRLVLRATAADIDDLAHVSNLVYLRWVLEVATSHSVAVGWDHPQYREVGACFVVRRHEIDYLAPILENDEVELVTWIESWRGASSQRRTEIRKGGVVAARASTLWAFVDFAKGRPRRIPGPILAAFGAVTSSEV